jgi:murein DD-endopeptidase MepM/ murein hydrolase activator NlpD
VDGPDPTKEPRRSSDDAPEAAQDEGEGAAATESTGETPQTAALTPASARSLADAPRPPESMLAPPGGAAPRKRSSLPVRARVALALAGGAALVAAIVVPLAGGTGSREEPALASGGTLAATVAAGGAVAQEGGANGAAAPADEAAPAHPPTWRVAQLADDASLALVEGVVARRPLLAALGSAGLPRSEAQRIARSLGDVRDVDRFGAKDTFTVARDRASGHVVAYEVASSPIDVWQAREQAQPDGTNKLVARKLELSLERVRVRKALVVGADLRASFAEAGLGPIDDVLSMLDDALEGHAELSDIRPGARLRLVATQERVEGTFARWASLEAVEYFPASPSAPPVRVYFLGGDEERPQGRRGWYDAKGRQPYHGGWRSPVPLARIASRFNPHRMHPVLHVVMPHNGVDFAAPTGAPVYATAAGVVTSVGNGGPCGNMVEIAHPGGITSVYCHLSRFGSGLHVGQHVESRQLIAYVGQTGRVTGPHLHFGIKKNGVFIDPMTLRLDGVRVVPRGRRDEFDHMRAALDAELDAIPLPAPGANPAPPEASEPDTFYEEPP